MAIEVNKRIPGLRHVNAVKCMVVLVLLLFSIADALSIKTTNISANEDFVNLSPFLSYQFELDGPISVYSLLSERSKAGWTVLNKQAVNFGFAKKSAWFSVKLKNKSTFPVSKLLRIAYPFLDLVNVYFIKNGTIVGDYRLGDTLPFDQRVYLDPTFVVPLELEAEEGVEVLMRVETATAMQFSLELWSEKRYVNRSHRVDMLHGLYYGALLMALFYNLFLYFSMRDTNYLLYCAYVVSMIFFQLAIHGRGFQYVWSNNLWMQERIIAISLSGIFLSLAMFSIRFLALKSAKEWQYISMLITIGVASVFMVLSVTLSMTQVMPWFVAILGTATIYSLVIGTTRWHMGYKPAAFYTVSFIFFMTGSLLMALSRYGILPPNFITNNGQQIGSLLEVVLLSFGLGYRIKIMQREQSRLTLKLNAKLEQEVSRRTRELQESNEKLEKLNQQLELSTVTDSLTNIKNRRYFTAQANSELKRAIREQHPLSLLLIDVDHFKRFNDDYGHLIGDDCLKHVASQIQGCLHRPGDFVVRFGGEEFAVVLPDTRKRNAKEMAESVRAAIENNCLVVGAQQYKVTASVGLACFEPSGSQSMRLETLIAQADEALYRAKGEGRNRVCVHSKTVEVN